MIATDVTDAKNRVDTTVTKAQFTNPTAMKPKNNETFTGNMNTMTTTHSITTLPK